MLTNLLKLKSMTLSWNLSKKNELFGAKMAEKLMNKWEAKKFIAYVVCTERSEQNERTAKMRTYALFWAWSCTGRIVVG